MSLQETFYLVGIVTMSLMTLLFLMLIVVLIYIWVKIGELAAIIEKRMDDLKNFIRHPGKIAAAVGGAVVDTAVEQVAKMTDGRKRRKR